MAILSTPEQVMHASGRHARNLLHATCHIIVLSTSSSSLSSVAIRRLPRHSRPLLFIPTVQTLFIPLNPHSLGFSLSLRSSVCRMGIQFGSFNGICQTAALVICPLIGSDQGIEPSCYSRNVDIAGTLIFQPCELFPIPRGFKPSYPHIVVNRFFPSSNSLVPCPAILSDMFRPRRRNTDDWHHDLSHTKQIHCRW